MGEATQVTEQRKTLTQRVLSNSAWSIISEGLGKGLIFFAHVYLARVLGVQSFGRFTLVQNLTRSFWLGVDLGTTMYGTREIAKEREKADEIINDLLALRIAGGLAVLGLFLVVLFFLPMTAVTRLAASACALYLVTYSFYTDWAFRGLEKFEYIAIGSFLMGVAFVGGSLWMVRTRDDLVVASLVWSLSALFGSVPLLLVLRKKLHIPLRLEFRPRAWLFHCRESIFFTIGGVLQAVYQYLPAFLLAIFFTSYEVGLFSAPFRMMTTISGAGMLLPTAFYPILSESYRRDTARFRRAHHGLQVMMIALGLPVAVVGALYAEPIVKLFFGSQYMGSVPVFKILIWIVPLTFFRYTYGYTLAATGLQRRQNIAALGATSCLVLAGILLIPKFGVLGAAWAVVGSEIPMIAFMYWMARPVFEPTELS